MAGVNMPNDKHFHTPLITNGRFEWKIIFKCHADFRYALADLISQCNIDFSGPLEWRGAGGEGRRKHLALCACMAAAGSVVFGPRPHSFQFLPPILPRTLPHSLTLMGENRTTSIHGRTEITHPKTPPHTLDPSPTCFVYTFFLHNDFL